MARSWFYLTLYSEEDSENKDTSYLCAEISGKSILEADVEFEIEAVSLDLEEEFEFDAKISDAADLPSIISKRNEVSSYVRL